MKMRLPLGQTYKPTIILSHFPKMGQYIGGKWLILGTKHHLDILLRSLESKFRI